MTDPELPRDDALMARVNDVLDRRGDPFDDPLIQRWLVDAPARVDEVARLRDLVADLASLPVEPARGRWPIPRVAAAAGMLLGAWALLRVEVASPPTYQGARPVIHRAESSVTLRTPRLDQRWTRSWGADHVESQTYREVRRDPQLAYHFETETRSHR